MKIMMTLMFIVIIASLFSACGRDGCNTNESTIDRTTSNTAEPTTTANTTGLITDITISTDVGSTATESLEEWIAKNKVTLEAIPIFDPDSKVLSKEEAQKEYSFAYLPSYRKVYYSLKMTFPWIDEDEENEWWNQDIEKYKDKEPGEMVIVSYIKRFRISKEEFENAVERHKQRDIANGLDIKKEEYEPYNVDIIYTFDDAVINDYYRRDK